MLLAVSVLLLWDVSLLLGARVASGGPRAGLQCGVSLPLPEISSYQ